MNVKSQATLDRITSILEQNTRGVQIAIYTVASVGLAYAIHIVRPVSKFSKAVNIPRHFLKNKEPLKGRIVGCELSTTSTRLLFDHNPIVRIPLWHSNQAPLKIQVWGVQPTNANTFSWLQCIAVGNKATVIPMKCNEEFLVSQVTLHLPIISPHPGNKKLNKRRKKESMVENIDLAEKLIELGLGKVTTNVAKYSSEDIWWTPWLVSRDYSSVLQRAQHKAIAHRAGYWQEVIPPSRFAPMMKSMLSIFNKKSNINLNTVSHV